MEFLTLKHDKVVNQIASIKKGAREHRCSLHERVLAYSGLARQPPS